MQFISREIEKRANVNAATLQWWAKQLPKDARFTKGVTRQWSLVEAVQVLVAMGVKERGIRVEAAIEIVKNIPQGTWEALITDADRRLWVLAKAEPDPVTGKITYMEVADNEPVKKAELLEILAKHADAGVHHVFFEVGVIARGAANLLLERKAQEDR